MIPAVELIRRELKELGINDFTIALDCSCECYFVGVRWRDSKGNKGNVATHLNLDELSIDAGDIYGYALELVDQIRNLVEPA